MLALDLPCDSSGFFVLERARPGWPLPQRAHLARACARDQRGTARVVILLGGYHLGPLVPARLDPGPGRCGCSRGPAGLAAYFIATFVFYWWHRWRHEYTALAPSHQIHHSPRRLEVITSFYKHPGEMIVNSIIGSALVYSVLGLSLEAGAVYTLCTALGEFFYHTDGRTPRWVGYVFQRPEMHRIHHQTAPPNNYGDITWWDMLFGTYENPDRWEGRCGFLPDDEERLADHAGVPRRARALRAPR